MPELSAEDRLKQASVNIPDVKESADKLPISTSVLKKRQRMPFIFLGGVVFVIIVLFSFVAFSVYASVDLPLLGEKQEQALSKMFYRIPIFPKTSKQILIVASDANAKLTRYTPDFSLTGSVGSNSMTLGSFDLAIVGPVDITPGSPAKLDLLLNAGVTFGGEQYTVSGKLKKDGETMYAKIDELSENIIQMSRSILGGPQSANDIAEIQQNLDEVMTNWLIYDMSGLDTESRKLMTEQGGDKSLIDTARKKALEIVFEESVLPEIQKMPDEKVDGVATYHLQFAPSRATLITILKEYNTFQGSTGRILTDKEIDDAVGSIEKLQIDVYFGKRDAILRKMSMQVTVSLNSLTDYSTDSFSGGAMSFGSMITDQLVDMKLKTSTVLIIRDIGKKFDVDPPQNVLTPKEFSKALQDALMTEEARAQKIVKDQYDSDMDVFSKALLRYYVANQVYPSTLQELIGIYIPSNNPLSKRVNTYKYRTSSDRKKYILYVNYDYPDLYSSYSSPLFYGITNSYKYPSTLSTADFSEIY